MDKEERQWDLRINKHIRLFMDLQMCIFMVSIFTITFITFTIFYLTMWQLQKKLTLRFDWIWQIPCVWGFNEISQLNWKKKPPPSSRVILRTLSRWAVQFRPLTNFLNQIGILIHISMTILFVEVYCSNTHNFYIKVLW